MPFLRITRIWLRLGFSGLLYLWPSSYCFQSNEKALVCFRFIDLFLFFRVERNIVLSWLSYLLEMKFSDMSSLSCQLVGPALFTYVCRQTTYTQKYVESVTQTALFCDGRRVGEDAKYSDVCVTPSNICGFWSVLLSSLTTVVAATETCPNTASLYVRSAAPTFRRALYEQHWNLVSLLDVEPHHGLAELQLHCFLFSSLTGWE